MAAVLNSVEIRGFDSSNPGDAVATVSLGGMSFQAGEAALWDFVRAVETLVSGAQNVDSVITTRFETVSTVI